MDPDRRAGRARAAGRRVRRPGPAEAGTGSRGGPAGALQGGQGQAGEGGAHRPTGGHAHAGEDSGQVEYRAAGVRGAGADLDRQPALHLLGAERGEDHRGEAGRSRPVRPGAAAGRGDGHLDGWHDAHPPARRQGAVGQQLLYPGQGRPPGLHRAVVHRAEPPLDAEGPALPDALAGNQLRGSGVREDRRAGRHGARSEAQDGG